MSLSLQDYAHIATIFTGLGVLGIASQVLYSYKQIKADHERSRREKSIEILMAWSKNLKKEGSIARRIIECLNEEQCREIFNQQAVKISRKNENLVRQLFKKEDLIDIDAAASEISLTEAQSTELRWHAITYLNTLEFSLVAWQYAVVDKDIIEAQFQYLFRPADGHEVLKYFRKAAGGGNSYPAIEIFTAHVSEKRRRLLIQKGEIF